MEPMGGKHNKNKIVKPFPRRHFIDHRETTDIIRIFGAVLVARPEHRTARETGPAQNKDFFSGRTDRVEGR